MFNLNIKQFNYYTLQEASEYLNEKHNTTSFKLLRKIIEYKVRLFIYGRGFELTIDRMTERANYIDDAFNGKIDNLIVMPKTDNAENH